MLNFVYGLCATILATAWAVWWFVLFGTACRLWWVVRDGLFAAIAGLVWWRVEREYEEGAYQPETCGTE